MPYTIEELRRIITPIAQAHGLRSVSLFGSYSKGTARRGSDVDLKIEKGGVMSLFQLSGLRLAMEDALQVPVDLVTNDASDRDFLNMIAKDEVLLYRSSLATATVCTIIWSVFSVPTTPFSGTTCFRTPAVCVWCRSVSWWRSFRRKQSCKIALCHGAPSRTHAIFMFTPTVRSTCPRSGKRCVRIFPR